MSCGRSSYTLSASKEKGQSHVFLTYWSLVSPSTILNKTRGKRIRCTLRSINAHAEQETNVEATVYVKELDLFVTEKLLEDTPAALSLGKTQRRLRISL